MDRNQSNIGKFFIFNAPFFENLMPGIGSEPGYAGDERAVKILDENDANNDPTQRGKPR